MQLPKDAYGSVVVPGSQTGAGRNRSGAWAIMTKCPDFCPFWLKDKRLKDCPAHGKQPSRKGEVPK